MEDVRSLQLPRLNIPVVSISPYRSYVNPCSDTVPTIRSCCRLLWLWLPFLFSFLGVYHNFLSILYKSVHFLLVAGLVQRSIIPICSLVNVENVLNSVIAYCKKREGSAKTFDIWNLTVKLMYSKICVQFNRALCYLPPFLSCWYRLCDSTYGCSPKDLARENIWGQVVFSPS